MAQAVGKKAQESLFTGSFSSFSVNDLSEAKDFYEGTLGIKVTKTEEGLQLEVENSDPVFIYPKDDHEPATFTVLNLNVDDIEEVVDELTDRGVTFETYEGEMETDDKGIAHGAEKGHGPNIAWFKDPAGNFISLIEN